MFSGSLSGAFIRAQRRPHYGRTFVKILGRTHTMIANARWDDAVDSEAIPPALGLLFEDSTDSMIRDVQFGSAMGENRPARFTVRFRDVPGIPAAPDREVFFPAYENSGHSVTVTEPEKFTNDVAEFFRETGLLD